MAAIHGLGLRGIQKKLKLPYGPIGSPGVTRETLVHLPTSLEAATAQFMRKGSVAREVFGDFFVDHFGGTREHELMLFRRAVTDWESELGFGFADFSAEVYGAGVDVERVRRAVGMHFCVSHSSRLLTLSFYLVGYRHEPY